MKLDNDNAVLQSLAHTPTSKSLKNSSDITEIANQTKIEAFPEPKQHETNNVGFCPVSDFNVSESPAKLQKGNEVADDTNLLDEFSVFTDKNVTECEVSEIVITPSETQQPSCHEVKEICMDETAVPKKKTEHDGSDVSEKEGLNTIATNESPYNSKLEEDKGVWATIKDDDTLSSNPNVNHVSDSLACSDRDFYGESSFSMVGPMSGLISYSGNLSLRSESSTTSTRSFAFPIMQNEWNSSPVKMAKVDRSRLQKSKGWRQGILCCKF